MYWCAYKTATLTSIQHTVHGGGRSNRKQTQKLLKPFQILNPYKGAACAVLIAVFNLYVNNAKSTRFSGEHCLKEKQS